MAGWLLAQGRFLGRNFKSASWVLSLGFSVSFFLSLVLFFSLSSSSSWFSLIWVEGTDLVGSRAYT